MRERRKKKKKRAYEDITSISFKGGKKKTREKKKANGNKRKKAEAPNWTQDTSDDSVYISPIVSLFNGLIKKSCSSLKKISTAALISSKLKCPFNSTHILAKNLCGLHQQK